MSVESLFLQCAVDKLRQFVDRIESCVGKLDEDQIWTRGTSESFENQNAIGNLMLHLAGNVRQWIVSTLGNQADHRNRDGEFNARGGVSSAELISKLRDTVEQATQIIASLSTQQLTRSYAVQGYTVSGVQAVFHVVEHFSQHTGQIIFATKMLTGADMGFYRHLQNPAHMENVP
jgi:uncharacterized damage-inducible protein DinB